ncbi:MAG: heavy-metal-associated domain-containing protein [Cyclobacteriaceae bacterium]
METIKFKTNINCGGCLKSVTPHLNELDSIESWKVDIENPNKILEVEVEGDENEVIKAVVKAGFEIERV